MRLASFLRSGRPGYGVVSDTGVHPVSESMTTRFPDLRSAITGGVAGALADHCSADAIPLTDLTLLPPIPNPGRIVCAGLNYRKPDPVEGVAAPETSHVVLFSRFPDSLVGHGAELEMPLGDAAETFDFEAEIAAVIGKAGRNIPAEQALDHVFGYSAVNEGSVRGWLKHSVHAAKNFHASGSWGPWITTADEAGDVATMRVESYVNGVQMQSATGSEMIFDLPSLIAYISTIHPLEPGDVIATGSPDGVGGSRKPPVFLKPGDTVEIRVSGVGSLTNTVGPANRG